MFRRIFLTLRLGIYSLLLHKLRSGLAVLGILIGITAVIWLVAMGEGVSYQAQQQIKDLGANNIIVRSVKPSQTSSKLGSALFIPYGVLRDDYKRIISNIPIDRAGRADAGDQARGAIRRQCHGSPAGRLHAGVLRPEPSDDVPRAGSWKIATAIPPTTSA